MNRRLLTYVGAALITILYCTSLSANSAPIKLTWMDWWGAEAGEANLAIAREFERLNPGIEIEYVNPSGNSNVTYEAAIVSTAAGAPPDIVGISQTRFGDAIASGLARSIDAYVQRDQLEGAFLDGVLEGGRFQGELYGLPKVFNPSAMFINLNALLESGLATPSRDWTLSEFTDYARRLTISDSDGSVVRYGTGELSLTYGPWEFLNGGRYIDPETSKAAITEPEFVEMLQWMADLGNVHGATGPRTWSAWMEGKTAMFEFWLTGMDRLLQSDHEWVTSPFPRGEGGTKIPVLAHSYVINSASAHPEEAWAFLKFVSTSQQSEQILAQNRILTPTTPSGARLLTQETTLPGWASIEQVYGAFINVPGEVVMPPYATPGFSDVFNNQINPALRSVLRGEKSAAAAMNEIVDVVNGILAEARQ